MKKFLITSALALTLGAPAMAGSLEPFTPVSSGVQCKTTFLFFSTTREGPCPVYESRVERDNDEDHTPTVTTVTISDDVPYCERDEQKRDKPKKGKSKRSKTKSDNSDANGKGGNRHDRADKTKGGTEVAEDKKSGRGKSKGGRGRN